MVYAPRRGHERGADGERMHDDSGIDLRRIELRRFLDRRMRVVQPAVDEVRAVLHFRARGGGRTDDLGHFNSRIIYDAAAGTYTAEATIFVLVVPLLATH